MRPAGAAGCHQGAPGSTHSSKGLGSHRTPAVGPVMAITQVRPQPCRRTVDLEIGSKLRPSIVVPVTEVNSFVSAYSNDSYSTTSAEPTAFIFLLCQQDIPLLDPLSDAVTTEEEWAVDALSQPYGHVQTGRCFPLTICSQGLPWSSASRSTKDVPADRLSESGPPPLPNPTLSGTGTAATGQC